MAVRGRASPARAVVGLTAVASGLALAALPVFLVGGLAVQIRSDLGFSETELGAAVTATFVVGAALGPVGGRIADRIGARAAVLGGAALSTASLAGITLVASGWMSMAAFLALAGIALSLMDPGLAILITRTTRPGRQGLAFGVKEASIPTATLLAGLAVPSVALTLGWRWAFTLGVVPLAALAWTLPRLDLSNPISPTPLEETGPPPPRRAVVTVALGAAVASSAASGISVFLTESAVAMGMEPGPAGILLATGSVAGIATRVGTGIRADRHGGTQLGLMSAMMAVGAVAMVLAAMGGDTLLVIGTIGAFAGGWGWSGLLFLSLVRSSPAAPGAVAGIGLAGLAIGNAVGPLAFGAAAQHLSFSAAWTGAATLTAVAALLMWRARPAFLAAHAPSSG
ncbi:MAG: MFS transporter [Actinomycetota bacterium]